jgi:tRNA-specific 2-thiouridylase
VIFPVGDLTKPEVREIARKAGLVTHDKKDSTGICFIGERNFNNFLREHLGDREGEIKTLDGRVVGRHKGLCYYTIGQGKGMGLGATKTETDKWFVVKKDLSTNTLFVNNGDCPELYSRSLVAADFNWISDIAAFDFRTKTLTAKTRYRQPDQECTVEIVPRGTFSSVRVTFKNSQRAVTAGQWVVLYDGEVCLGGGEITEVGE